MKNLFHLLVFAYLIVYGYCALPFIQVDPVSQHFIDEYGRVRIFHGMNVIYKVPPYIPDLNNFHPQNSLTNEDIENLHKWGFNIVRFYVAWMGVNPTSEKDINQDYLDNISRAIQMMENKNIYTLLDCHQDLFSRYFCGEGVPDWIAAKLGDKMIKSFPKGIAPSIAREPDTGYPKLEECLSRPFFKYYFTEAVMNSFKMLYKNDHGTLDAFASFWRTVAQNFVNCSSVIGYELLNEPVWPTLFDVINFGNIDRTYLAPMYKKLHQVIRTVDDKHIIFYEPAASDIFKTGLKEGPGGVSYNDRQAFSYHVYCISVNDRGEPKSDFLCDLEDKYNMKKRYEEAKEKKLGGMMLTEFGALSSSPASVKEMNRITGLADQYLQSWVYWQFKKYEDLTTAARPATTESFYNENGELEINKVKALSRSYAQAIAGLPTSMSFNPETCFFRLVFQLNTSIDQPTIIYLNEDFHYEWGAIINITPTNALTWVSKNRNYYEFTKTASVANGTTVKIEISPKSSGGAFRHRK